MIFALAIAAVPSFVASIVEWVEAFTIVLAVGNTRGWRSPIWGTAAGLASLAVIVGVFGTPLIIFHERVSQSFHIVVGILLLLFGLRWLRKAILRFAGIVALHDEELIYQQEIAALRSVGSRPRAFDRVGALVAYKAVLLEGTEVAFIVIAFGAGGGSALTSAIVGAAVAGLVVIALAVALRRPLTMVPENWLKFGVGAILSSFGVFWFGEGLGSEWPGDAASLAFILAAFLTASWLGVRILRALLPVGARLEARNI